MNLTLKEMFSLINVNVPDELASIPFPLHVATDSRSVVPGGAFIALEGEHTDGHNFIQQAVQNGAALIIAKRGKNIPSGISAPVIELEDPEKYLANLAAKRLAFQGQESQTLKDIIAITGSVGKTTTRAALEQVLRSRFKVHAPERSFNTLIGCTSTILAMPLETEILILEFGANKPGEIAELTRFFQPTIAVLTAIAPVHLEGFKSVQGVLKEKLEITKSKRIRKVFFNNDNKFLHEFFSDHTAHDLRVVSVGNSNDSDFKIELSNSHYELPALSFDLRNQATNKLSRFKADVWGQHMSMPLAIAASVGHELGMALDECAEELSKFRALPGRGRVISLGENAQRFLIDDAYNANPASMRASLETFATVNVKGKLAVLGEMREMGENATAYHKELEDLLKKIDHVIFVGKIWQEAFSGYSGYFFAENWQKALEITKKILSSNDVQGILVKGSNSLGLSNIVKELS